MVQYQIAVLIGSLRKESINRKLANAVVKLAPSEFTFKQLRIDDLPLYNQDNDRNPADSVKRLKSEIRAADAVLFVTPEYNRSMPGVLKNAIDNASRPYGDSAFGSGKPAGTIGMSPGNIGTAIAQQHLKNSLSYLDMVTLGQPEMYLKDSEGFFDQAGNLSEDKKQFMQQWMDKYVGFVKYHVPK